MFFRRAKPASKEFLESDLPKTRKELFNDLLKNHYVLLIKLGVLLFLFSALYLFVSVNKDIKLVELYSNYESAAITLDEFNVSYREIINMSYLFKTIGIVVFVIGLMGVLKVIRRLAFGEPVFLKEDFLSGIKENFVTALIIGLFMGVIIYSANLLQVTITNKYLSVIPIGILYAIILPMCFLSLVMAVIYNAKPIGLLKSGLSIYFKSALTTILASLVLFAIMIVTLVKIILYKYIAIILYITFVLPMLILFFYMYCCYIFDKNINIYYHREIYDKGINRHLLKEEENSNEIR